MDKFACDEMIVRLEVLLFVLRGVYVRLVSTTMTILREIVPVPDMCEGWGEREEELRFGGCCPSMQSDSSSCLFGSWDQGREI